MILLSGRPSAQVSIYQASLGRPLRFWTHWESTEASRSLPKLPEASRSLQEPPEASRSRPKPPEASRSLQKPPEASLQKQASRSLQKPAEASRSLQQPPGASRSLQEPPEASRSLQKPSDGFWRLMEASGRSGSPDCWIWTLWESRLLDSDDGTTFSIL